MEFESGKIYGIIGRNGSGKTVLLKCICGLMDTTDGTVSVNGKIVGKDVILSVKGSKSDQDEKTVTGTVVDEMGEPIIGANIVEKGKANGTMSDLNGHFSIVVSSDAVLQISYIGFSLHEEAVKNKNVLQVIMKEDTQKLDEVVVVGYGSVDKKRVDFCCNRCF